MIKKINNLKSKLNKEGDQTKRIHLLISLAHELSRIDVDEALLYSRKSIREARSLGRAEPLAESLMCEAKCLRMRGDTVRSVACYNKALIIYKRQKDLDAILDVEEELIANKLVRGVEKDALISLHEVLNKRINTPTLTEEHQGLNAKTLTPRGLEDRVFGRIPSIQKMRTNNLQKVGRLTTRVGIAYHEIGDHQKALIFLKSALRIWTELKDPVVVAKVKMNLGNVYTHLKEYDLALKFLSSSLRQHIIINDMRGIAMNKVNLADVFFEVGDARRAKKAVLDAFKIFQVGGYWQDAAKSLHGYAEYERLHGSLIEAQKINKLALKQLEDREVGEVYVGMTLQQFQIQYATTKDRTVYSQLVELYEKSSKIGIGLQLQIAQELLKIAEENEWFKESFQWLKKVSEYEINRFDLEQRKRIESLEISHEVERLAKERELYKFKAKELQKEVTSKKREVELLADQLAKKGSLFAALKNQLISMQSSNGKHSPRTLNEITGFLESLLHRDNEFENLEKQANLLYSDFTIALLQKSKNLTETEKKICILLRLGLSPVNIADILFSSIRTVQTHCLRIRKKLRVPVGVRLPKYLSSLHIKHK